MGHPQTQSITIDEIRSSYDELSEPEFFEAMDAAMVDDSLLDLALGAGVVQEYANWIYLHIK